MVLWPTLPVRELSIGCRRVLSALMDPPDPLGKDWCLLAVQLGLTESVAHLDAAVHPSHPTQSPTLSQTNALLERWTQTEDSEATLGEEKFCIAGVIILFTLPHFSLFPLHRETCKSSHLFGP